MKPLWKVAQIVSYNWVVVAKDKSNHPVAGSLSLRRAGVEQLYQVKRMIGGIGNMFVSVAQNVKVMKSQTCVGKRPSRLSLR